MLRPLALAAALCTAAPALALDGPDGFADFAMSACLTPWPDEMVLSDAGFDNTFEGPGKSEFSGPEAAELTLAAEQDLFSCELHLPDTPEDAFDPYAQALSAMIAERFSVTQPETTENGLLWRILRGRDTLTEAMLERDPGGGLRLTAVTRTDAAPDPDMVPDTDTETQTDTP